MRRSSSSTSSSASDWRGLTLSIGLALGASIAFSFLQRVEGVGNDLCTYASSLGGTFDLSDLIRYGEMPSYSVTDGDIPCTPEVEQNYTYLFNICNSVSGEVPLGCEPLAAKASALQIDKRPDADPSNMCWKAGGFDATTKEEAAKRYLSLLDSNDPSKGLRLTYRGEDCHHNDDGKAVPTPRIFKIDFECADIPVAVPVHALEYHHCDYTIGVPSIFGCPIECPIAGKRLCAGKGHCAYDKDKRQPRCFCDEGFQGIDCTISLSQAQSSAHQNKAITGVVVTLFVLVVLLAFATLAMFRQVKAYKEDATNYIMLAGGDVDEGGV